MLITLGIGLLPPLMAQHGLNRATFAAANAGSLALARGGSPMEADAAALQAIAKDGNVKIVSMGQVPGTSAGFAVTTQERVHSLMDGVAELKGWFVVTSTQKSNGD